MSGGSAGAAENSPVGIGVLLVPVFEAGFGFDGGEKMNAIVEIPPIELSAPNYSMVGMPPRLPTRTKRGPTQLLEGHLQNGLTALEEHVRRVLRGLDRQIVDVRSLNEEARAQGMPTTYDRVASALAHRYELERDARDAALAMMRRDAVEFQRSHGEETAAVVRRATRRFITVTDRLLDKLHEVSEAMAAEVRAFDVMDVARGSWYRATMAYSDALVRVFGGAVTPLTGIEVADGTPVGVVTGELPPDLLKDAGWLVDQELLVHEHVERSDPSLVGRVALEFRPITHGA